MERLIYVADDEKNIRELIATFLKSEGFQVKTFENGDKLYSAFLDTHADMIVLDIMMPGTDGLSLCTKLRQVSNVPIIIVSARDSEIDRITGITLGSDDYLTKPFSPMELVARVKAMFRRLDFERKSTKDEKLVVGNVSINRLTRTVTVEDKEIELTPTEFALMVYLFENKEKAVSREELLENVWKLEYMIDTRATDDVIKRLRKKLSLQQANIAIESVWGYGFKLEERKNENA
ncbi:response regulator transcription factor [Paludicola sp. MB14-C6]|uniref:response regulator transcription factor n=1 Tax=Paludihabitans sp. MB14-C6 TaxID=3070656 RepID=UPI0027DC598C|nr:response regulator transcription factor [Paludicola sp. MB14-C6]WMJ24020.1 response regulator transcription factor [Paludicola sp. MB14-C6]